MRTPTVRGKRLLAAAALLTAIVVPATANAATASRPSTKGPGGVGVMADQTYLCNRPGLVPADALCAPTLSSLNIRTGPSTGHGVVSTMWAGADFWLHCWAPGESINGDNVWYFGTHITGPWPPDFPQGYAAGYYLGTGRDPHPAVRRC